MVEVVEVKTIGEVERIVLASGEFDGQGPVEFSNNGAPLSWSQAWLPSEEYPHPVFARTEVYRKGVRLPQKVLIRWDEQVPVAEPEWAEKWYASPMRHFGRTARMVALRQMFRDLLGDVVIEDEADEVADIKSKAEPEPDPRDLAAEFDAARTVEELDEAVKAARKARVFKPDAAGTALDRKWKARRKELLAAVLEQTEKNAAEVTAPKPASAHVSVSQSDSGKSQAKPAPKQSGQRQRKRRPSRPARPGHSVAENIDSDVAEALAALRGDSKA